jgi:hypothetical protein
LPGSKVGGNIQRDRTQSTVAIVNGVKVDKANEYRLDKEQTSHNDILDAFRLQFYKRSKA